MRKLTESERKLQDAVNYIQLETTIVVAALKEGCSVKTDRLITIMETQSTVINSLLDGFLEL